jgi:hypothetical protein
MALPVGTAGTAITRRTPPAGSGTAVLGAFATNGGVDFSSSAHTAVVSYHDFDSRRTLDAVELPAFADDVHMVVADRGHAALQLFDLLVDGPEQGLVRADAARALLHTPRYARRPPV